MSDKNKVGRKPRPICYKDVTYNDKQYIVGTITSNKGLVKFIFDKEFEEKVKGMSWFVTSSGYISSHHSIEKHIRGQLLLHRFILDVPYFPGKGAKETVDHINRNPLDNRKENLRIVSQTEQNLNQKKKPRNNVQLPETSGITPDDIPRHVWYIKANGAHGDRFAIEFKTENLVWKSSSSKKLSLQEKLTQAKQKLEELYVQYPYLNPDTNAIVHKAEELTDSFQEIISLAV